MRIVRDEDTDMQPRFSWQSASSLNEANRLAQGSLWVGGFQVI